jgi:translocation and assembly module TamB
MDETANRPVEAPRRRRWLRRSLYAAGALVAVVVALIVAAVAWISSQSALERALAELTQRSGGALTFEGSTGSLLSEMRARRVEYRDAHIHVVADGVTFAWSPTALRSRAFHVRTLDAQRIVVTLMPSDTPSSLPESLALPIDVRVDRAAVARLELVSGEATRVFSDIAFAYAGGAAAHHVRDVGLRSTEWGSLRGEAALAARPPFAVQGAIALTASERLARAAANVTLGGTLGELDVKFAARVGAATASGGASVAPLAAMPLVAATIDARDVDVAQFAAASPHTLLSMRIDARADGGGRYSGTFDAANGAPGPIDTDRLPLSALRARFAFSPTELEFADLTAELGGAGRLQGSGRIDLATAATLPPSEWNVTVRQLDLARVYRPAIATRLAGRVRAHVERGVQRVDADLTQGDRALAFVATVAADVVDVQRFRARAANGEAAGRGKIGLRGSRRFEIAATATRFDPSRFFAAPAASINGTIDATGELGSRWHADGRITVQPSSRYAGVAVSGSASGRVSAEAIVDATVDAKVADASLHATGSFGRPGDTLAFDVDVPQLASLAPLLPSRLAAGVAGRWRARGTVTGDPTAPGGNIAARGERLAYDDYAIGELDVRASIAPARSAASTAAVPIAERPLAVALTATDVRAADRRFARAALSIDGTLSRHVASASVAGDDLDASARLDGGFTSNATVASPAWMGTVTAFDNRGTYALHLAAPARLSWARDRIELGEARVAVADGTLRVAVFNWREGRIDTRGAFNGVPAAAIARLVGAELPLRSTIVLGGDWDIAAAPRLTGSVHVRRESGDLFAGAGVLTAGEIPFAIETLELAATIANDTVDASATLRAGSLGSAHGTLRVGNVAGARAGFIAPDAPISADVNADVASLAPLQSLLGTSALVDGRIAVSVQARGTPRNLAVSGSVVASEVKLAAPQYGVHWTDGRLRARLADGVLALDELSLTGGDGRFTASGTLVAFRRAGATGSQDEPTTAVTWRAERFRAANRPDLRLVVDGNGTLGASQGRLLLKGEMSAREGHVELARSTTSRLGPDVVVAGVRKPPPSDRFANVPLALDLDLDLGSHLDISGRGIDARLEGKVHVATTAAKRLTARGTIRTVGGTYVAFGQRLAIQRGRLIFDGPIDNPALDVVALRKNLPVEAGVEISGTVNVPRVQLVSEPPVPDGEKLSWLVLGQGLDRTSGADAAALQAAAATLFGDDRAPIGTTLARKIGLDDISVRSTAATTGTDSGGALSGQVLAVSKRLSDRLYLIYEQGLTVANNALKIEYVLTRNLTLRGEAGSVSGVGVYYQRSFE